MALSAIVCLIHHTVFLDIAMNAADSIRNSLDVGEMITKSYLGDLTDEELMLRPHSGCNHIKWQLGHLIASENKINNSILADSMPALPDGFADRYSKEAAVSDDPAKFDSKDDLFAAYEQQRAGTRAILDGASETDLDKPTPEDLQAFVRTLGAALNLHALHHLMHAGQWVIVRRSLGKPAMF
jgi:DinB superfamily